MVQDSLAIHHLHKRKRIHQKYEKYPHPNKFKRIMDKLIFFAGFLAIIMTIPQVLKIWVGQNASGVSIWSWSAYLFTTLIWLGYGIVHKDKAIIFAYSPFLILHPLIIIGTVLYG
ncbi:MAG: hypothetical protein KKG59_02910 [Nanoarchaeota archaeon]|nr:hypothetical protein [Nanoarchaeota archaeon]